MTEREKKQIVLIDYTNYKEERALRRVLPIKVFFGVTIRHPQPQWFLRALCLERQADRDFPLAKIHAWHLPPAEEFEPRVCLPPEPAKE